MSSSSTSRRRLPTNCKYEFPLVKRVSWIDLNLVKRVSWTDLNPGKRFLNIHNSNSNIPDKKKCIDFFWIDLEINNPWVQDQLERLQIEHDGLVSKFEQSRKSYKFTKIMIARIMVVVIVLKM
ncbi:hypothetical protein Tco_0317981 [Tanacetum coccineum]